MDVLVMVEESTDLSPLLAHVNSVPAPLHSDRPPREIVTLYGLPTPDSLALALAAAIEGSRTVDGGDTAIRHLGVWPGRGALGDAAWRDGLTGELRTKDLDIPFETLGATAAKLLSECEHVIQRLVAGLLMPDWPEGARRAITFSLAPAFAFPMGVTGEDTLDLFREADGLASDGGDD
jgi:hypothetical protein